MPVFKGSGTAVGTGVKVGGGVAVGVGVFVGGMVGAAVGVDLGLGGGGWADSQATRKIKVMRDKTM